MIMWDKAQLVGMGRSFHIKGALYIRPLIGREQLDL